MIYSIGDIHFGKLEKLIPGSTAKQFAVLDLVLARAVKSKVKDVMLPGDLFDVPHPRQSLIVGFLEVLAKYPTLTYRLLLGNHDWFSNEQHAFQILQWFAKNAKIKLHVYTKPTIVAMDGHKYWVCPHPYVQDQPAGCVASFGHFAWAGARTDTGYITKSTNSPKGFWVLNDYHTHQRGDRYVYAGSLTKLSFQEEGQKGFLRITGKDVDFIPFDEKTRGYDLQKLIVTTDKGLAALKAKPKDTYLSVVFAKGFLPPRDWQKAYPRIIQHVYKSASRKTKDKSRFVFDFSDNATEGMDAWLIANSQLEKAQRKQAIAQMDKLSRAST